MILVIARSGPVKIDFELEEEVSGRGRGQKIMTAVWKEFFFSFFFFSFYQRAEIFTGLGCGLGVEFLVYERYCCGFESVGTFRLKKKWRKWKNGV